MNYQDKTIVCRDCATEFIFSRDLQREFVTKGYNPPTRCTECHERRNARRKTNRGYSTKTHVAPCSHCGKDAVLPFIPTGSKPVFCAECFENQHAETEKVDNPDRKKFIIRKPEPIKLEPIKSVDDSHNSTSFSHFNLDPRIEKAIQDAGFDAPTPVQAATIPVGVSGRDLIGTAQTGTGKTAAFVLPILQHLLTNPVEKPRTRVIVLTPTRELAHQIMDSFRLLGKYTKIRVATVYGGVNMNPQERALRTGAEVIVACPGRLLDHIDRGNTDFSKVEKVVLDEADRMLDMGFLPPIKRILSYMPADRHTMLFSATFASELTKLVEDALKDPERIDVGISAPAKTVAHALYPCPQHLKTDLVLNLLDKIDANSVLIFTRTKHRANRVAQQIEKAGYGTTALHANKTQNQRQVALNDFRMGKCQILVATDIAARGLDVETISHVINYDIPDTADTYIHRIGRTGRAEREGDAMTLITHQDGGIVRDIERTLGSTIERRRLEDFNYNLPAPSADEFKRGPMPPRNTKPPIGKAKSFAKKRSFGKPKESASKTPSYFPRPRKRKSDF